ncbi:unnamed protein product [Victoria cruziana]
MHNLQTRASLLTHSPPSLPRSLSSPPLGFVKGKFTHEDRTKVRPSDNGCSFGARNVFPLLVLLSSPSSFLISERYCGDAGSLPTVDFARNAEAWMAMRSWTNNAVPYCF